MDFGELHAKEFLNFDSELIEGFIKAPVMDSFSGVEETNNSSVPRNINKNTFKINNKHFSSAVPRLVKCSNRFDLTKATA